MDDSSSRSDSPQPINNTRDTLKKGIQYGMDSFDAQARKAFGHELRIFMALKDGSATFPESGHLGKAMPDDAPAIARRLKKLGQDITSGMADQLELLVRYDDLKGWEPSGARHCVAWMNLELGISPQLAWEYLRVGRMLPVLPITRALFRAGKLTWSMVRVLSRVANQDNEALLCHTALDASVSDVERFCMAYRWQQAAQKNGSEDENARAQQQFDARSFFWKPESNGNTCIRLSLPPEIAQAVLNSVEQSLAQLEDSDATLPQRRADAAVLMAERRLQNAGREMATADRYQVIVSVDASELKQRVPPEPDSQRDSSLIPLKRPIIQGAGPVATETARRIACDCSVSTISHSEGEPIDIGRKSRLWPPAMTRAIKHRDQHCQYPGCTQSRHLHIHHIKHWADGGHTQVDNGVSLCAGHHTIVHEGGFRIERVSDWSNGIDEQFRRQQATEHTCNDVEKQLRDSRKSFELVRKLSPTRFRFRVVDQQGEEIRDGQDLPNKGYGQGDLTQPEAGAHSTRIERSFCDQWMDDFRNNASTDWPGVAEAAGQYRVGEILTC